MALKGIAVAQWLADLAAGPVVMCSNTAPGEDLKQINELSQLITLHCFIQIFY